MPEWTPEILAKYGASGGVRCPFCDDDQIEGDAVTIDTGGAFQDISCLSCGASWTDGYTLTAVITGDDAQTWHDLPAGK